MTENLEQLNILISSTRPYAILAGAMFFLVLVVAYLWRRRQDIMNEPAIPLAILVIFCIAVLFSLPVIERIVWFNVPSLGPVMADEVFQESAITEADISSMKTRCESYLELAEFGSDLFIRCGTWWPETVRYIADAKTAWSILK
jgi:hypothetical protein